MADSDGETPADARAWSARIAAATRSRESRVLATILKSGALVLAIAGRLDLIERGLRYVSPALVESDPQLLYWAGTSIVFKRPAEAYPLLQRAFELLSSDADSKWSVLAWAGLVDAIFLMYRDLSELDPLFAWMTPAREEVVDRMVRQERSLVVGSALFAFSFRVPHHPRMGAWRERAERLIEIDPTSALGARLVSGLICDYTWRGDLAAAEIVWKRFDARASRTRLSPLAAVARHLNESTLRLHQGHLASCLNAVNAGLKLSARHQIRVWEGVMRCHAVAASLSCDAISDAREHLAAIEGLFAEGVPVDEAYYRGMLLWCDFVGGDHVGAVSRCASTIKLTDTKGVPYLSAVCRVSAGLVLFEAGHRDRGRALVAEGIEKGREILNPTFEWIGGLFEAHMAYAVGDSKSGDDALHVAMRLGRDHSLAHFFCWPRRIIATLIDRALERGYATDYAQQLIDVHSMSAGDLPTRSHDWAFETRIYTFGEPRVVHSDGRIEPLSAQLKRQVELLASLIGKLGKPTSIQVVAADVYGHDEVDPVNSIKRVLHLLKARTGRAIKRERGLLALDFNKVWIDACSFQQLRRAGAGASEIEAWLAQHYHAHFLDTVENSDLLVPSLRSRLREQAERVIRDENSRCRQIEDEDALRRLELRWRHLFPDVFDLHVR
jgi:hypothetical protein